MLAGDPAALVQALHFILISAARLVPTRLLVRQHLESIHWVELGAAVLADDAVLLVVEPEAVSVLTTPAFYHQKVFCIVLRPGLGPDGQRRNVAGLLVVLVDDCLWI